MHFDFMATSCWITRSKESIDSVCINAWSNIIHNPKLWCVSIWTDSRMRRRCNKIMSKLSTGLKLINLTILSFSLSSTRVLSAKVRWLFGKLTGPYVIESSSMYDAFLLMLYTTIIDPAMLPRLTLSFFTWAHSGKCTELLFLHLPLNCSSWRVLCIITDKAV